MPFVKLTQSQKSRKICVVSECLNPVHIQSYGLCNAHYLRTRRRGTTDARILPSSLDCTVDGCHDKQKAKGYCGKHWTRYNAYGDPLHYARTQYDPVCSIDDCDGDEYNKGFCRSHYVRLRKHGDPMGGRWFNRGEGKTVEDRFWSRVALTADPNRCWEWQGSLTHGYGQVKFKGKGRRTHHVSWYLAHGTWPELCLLHSCDNRRCVNVNHLREGTIADNIHDMDAKGRRYVTRGEAVVGSKLTEKQVLAIRADGRKHGEIAQEYGVSPSNICWIKKRRNWKHI